MENNIKIYPEVDGDEITIRQGEALPLSHPKSLSITGTIDAPSRFFEKKADNYDWKVGHVIVDQMTIQLIWGEHQPHGSLNIKGVLSEDPALTAFGINSHRRYHQKELATLIKMNRIYFADRDENLKIVSNLEKFKARVTQEIENGNDFKGNKRSLFEQNVQHELILHFVLRISLFKGQPTKSFTVEINFDITDGNTSFWLESVDLKELYEVERRRIIESEVDKLKLLTIIYQ